LAASCRSLLVGQAVEVQVLEAAPDAVPDGLASYDGAIIGWGAYMHIPGRARRIAFLGQLRRHIRPGGPLLVSYFARRVDGRAFRSKAAIARVIRRLRFSSEPVEIGDSLDRTFDHWFTESDIRSELEQAGFETVSTAADPYGHAVATSRRG
jgi:hypothetical protein